MTAGGLLTAKVSKLLRFKNTDATQPWEPADLTNDVQIISRPWLIIMLDTQPRAPGTTLTTSSLLRRSLHTVAWRELHSGFNSVLSRSVATTTAAHDIISTPTCYGRGLDSVCNSSSRHNARHEQQLLQHTAAGLSYTAAGAAQHLYSYIYTSAGTCNYYSALIAVRPANLTGVVLVAVIDSRLASATKTVHVGPAEGTTIAVSGIRLSTTSDVAVAVRAYLSNPAAPTIAVGTVAVWAGDANVGLSFTLSGDAGDTLSFDADVDGVVTVTVDGS